MRVFFGAHNIVSPLGFTSRENFDALLAGKTALQKYTFGFSEKPFVCSKVEETRLKEAFSKLAEPDHYTHLEKLAILSINDVLEQSGLDLFDKQTLLIVSTTKGNIDVLENRYPHLPEDRAYLHQFSKTLGTFFRCANTPITLSNACISGLLALIMAKRFIESGSYKNVLVCGADLVSEFTLSGFKSFNAISDEACRPFDKHRTGINLGEAAASILLSSEPLSRISILSGASANDANHISGPSRTGEGLYKCVIESLKSAGKTSVDFISAHGTATEYNDDMESVAFTRASVATAPLHSLKGYYGHTLGAAGVVESIIAIQSLLENTLVKSPGFETPGTAQTLNVITHTEKKELTTCLKTASGFGGCNAAAIFEKV